MADYTRSEYLKNMLGRKKESSLYDSFVNPNDDEDTNEYQNYVNEFLGNNTTPIRTTTEKENNDVDNAINYIDNYGQELENQYIFGAGLADFGINIATGLAKFGEGIIDTGAMISGLFGDDEWKRQVNEFVGQDLFGAESWNDEVEKHTWYNDNDVLKTIIQGTAQGIGQMLPAVLLGAATGGASFVQPANLAALGVSSVGRGSEEALNEGADYGHALGYGIVSGAVETAIESIGGNKLTPTFLQDKIGGKALTGLAKVLKEGAEEGLEEVVSSLASPLTKFIYKGAESLKDYATSEYWRDTLLDGIVGFTSSLAVGGMSDTIAKIKGQDADVANIVQTNNDNLVKMQEIQTNEKLSDVDKAKKQASLLADTQSNLQKLEERLSKLSDKQRAKVIESLKGEDGRYYEGLIDENGKLTEFAKSFGTNKNENIKNINRGVLSQGQEEKIDKDLKETGATQYTETDLSNEKNFVDANKMALGLSKATGTNYSIFVVNNTDKFQAFVDKNGYASPQGNIVYITKDALLSDNWQEHITHELKHLVEGTSQEAKLNKLLSKQKVKLNSGEETDIQGIGNRVYDKYLSTKEKSAIKRVIKKIDNNKFDNLTKLEADSYIKLQSETNAILNGKVLKNTTFAEQMVRLADSNYEGITKLLNKVESLVKDTKEQRQIIRTFNKALEEYNVRYINGRIMSIHGDDEENETKYSKDTDEFELSDKEIKEMDKLLEELEDDELTDALTEELDGYVLTEDTKEIARKEAKEASLESEDFVWYLNAGLSKEAKEYFKDSVVKSDNLSGWFTGTKDSKYLIPMFHGTPASEMYFFDSNRVGTNGTQRGVGFYLTNSLQLAQSYNDDGKGKIIVGFVNITKPLNDTKVTIKRNDLAKLIKAIDKKGDGYLSNYGDINTESYNSILNKALNNLYDYQDTDVGLINEIYYVQPDMSFDEFFKTLKDTLGYDGIIYKNRAEGTIVVAYNSNQIKDINNTAPTSNEDIRFSKDIEKVNSNLTNDGIDIEKGKEIGKNIDVKGVNEYENDFRRIQEESRRLLKELEQSTITHKEIDDNIRQRYTRSIQKQLATNVNSTSNEYGVIKKGKQFNYKIYNNVDTKLFHDAFETIKPYLIQNELVDLHDNYDNCKCFLSEDGMQGFAIEEDGNLISVFNADTMNKSGFVKAVKDLIIKSGANHLDCYGYLANYYNKVLGFKTASIMDYNMDYDHHSIGKRFNYPQVAFMVNTNADVETKHFDKDSYVEAVNYQKSLIEVIPEIVSQNNEGLSNIAKRLTLENQKKLFEINNNKYLKNVEKWKLADRLDNDTIEYVYDYMKARNGEGEFPDYERVVKLNAYEYAEDYLEEHRSDLETWSDELYQSVLKESLDKILEGKKPTSANEQPTLFLVTGLAGAGKSSTGVNEYIKNGYVENDNDIFKQVESLEEYYNGGLGAGVVQKLVGEVQYDVSKHLFDNRYNVTIPLIGKKEKTIGKWLSLAKDRGYFVKWRHVNATEDLSISSSFVRFLQTGRYVSPNYTHGKNGVTVEQQVNDTVNTILNNKGVVKYNGKEYRIDDYEGVESSVPRGNEENRIHRQGIDRESGQRGYDIHSEARGNESNSGSGLSNDRIDKNKPYFSKDIEDSNLTLNKKESQTDLVQPKIRNAKTVYEELEELKLNITKDEILTYDSAFNVAKNIDEKITHLVEKQLGVRITSNIQLDSLSKELFNRKNYNTVHINRIVNEIANATFTYRTKSGGYQSFTISEFAQPSFKSTLKNAIKKLVDISVTPTIKANITTELVEKVNNSWKGVVDELKLTLDDYKNRIQPAREIAKRLISIGNEYKTLGEWTNDELINHSISRLLEPFNHLKSVKYGYKNSEALKNELKNLLDIYDEDVWDEKTKGENDISLVPYNPAIRNLLEKTLNELPSGKEVKRWTTDKTGRKVPLLDEEGNQVTEVHYGDLDANSLKNIRDTLRLISKTIQVVRDAYNKSYKPQAVQTLNEIQRKYKDKAIAPIKKKLLNVAKDVASSYTPIRLLLGNSALADEMTTGMSISISNQKLFEGSYTDRVVKKIKELGIKNILNNKVEFKSFKPNQETYKLSNDELVYIYTALKTNANYEAINESGLVFYDKNKVQRTLIAKGQAEKALNWFENNFSKDLIKYSEFLKETLNGDLKEEYKEWYKNKFHEEPNEIDDYWLMPRANSLVSSIDKMIKSIPLFKRSLSRNKKSNSPLVVASATNSVVAYARQLGKEIYVMPLYNECKHILNTKVKYTSSLAQQLDKIIGEDNRIWLNDILDEIAGKKENSYDNFLSFIMSGYSLKNLSFNAGTMFKQFASIWTSNIPMTKSFKAVVTRMFADENFKKEYKTLVDEIGSVKYRSGIIQAEVGTSKDGIFAKPRNFVSDVGMWGIRTVDYFTITTGLSSLMYIAKENGYEFNTKENIEFVKEHYEEFDLSQIGHNPLNLNDIARGKSATGQLGRFIFGYMQGANRAATASNINKFNTWLNNRKLNIEDLKNEVETQNRNVEKVEKEYIKAQNEFNAYVDELNDKGVPIKDYNKDERYKELKESVEEKQNTLIDTRASQEDANLKLKNYQEYQIMGGKSIPLYMASGLIMQGLFVTLLNEVMKHLKGKKDWDDWDLVNESGMLELLLNTTVGWIPVLNVLVNSIVKDYDIEVAYGQVINDIVDLGKSLINLTTKAISGEFTADNARELFKGIADATSDLTGIPFDKLYGYMVGTVRTFNPEKAIEMNNMFYASSYTYNNNQYNNYVEKGNKNSALNQLSYNLNTYKVETSKSTAKVLNELYMNGYDAMPKQYMTSYTNDKGETINLTKEQIPLFRKYYNESDKIVNDVINDYRFKNLSQESQAKIIKKIYDAYYSYAKARVLKQTKADNKLSTLLLLTNNKINISKYALALNNISSITDTKKKTRKELVIEYVNRMSGFTRQEKLLLLKLAGYSMSVNNESSLKSYLLSKGFNRKQFDTIGL